MKNHKLFSIMGVFILGVVAYGLSLGTSGCGGGGGNCNVADQTGCDDGLVCRATPDGGSGCFCNPATEAGCDEDQACEEITDGTTGCFEALVARGTVFNCADEATLIEGARVVALDVNGSPISTVALTDASGNYELEVPTRRNPDGTPAGDDFTLRSDAAAYQTFPSGIRQAIPVDTSSPTTEAAALFVIDNSLTDICLIHLEPGLGTGQIFGDVELPENSLGALVVAESSPASGFSAIADREGSYRIFNLPAGTYTVNAYVQGVNYDAASVTLADGEEKEVNLSLNDNATSILNGNVQIVNAPGGSATSVILVVESTFNETLVRGETPPGLRVPAPGTAPNISGSFTIDGIPVGTYVILAAFENDLLVRDPDTCISGTDILHQAFGTGETVDLSEGFKITEALAVISPGASGPETITTTTPTFTWEDDSSEENYRISVFDSFGNIVWETTIDGFSGGGNPSATYNADGTGAGTAQPLESGNFYQFRVTSTRTTGGGGGSTCEISQTEDLKGVFFVE
jgi:hypothetical protein